MRRTIRATVIAAIGLWTLVCSASPCEIGAAKMPLDDLSWMHGVNYTPSYAATDVETWLKYDPAVIDRELGYAEQIGLNCVRVFLQSLVYEHSPEALLKNFAHFVATADRHRLKVMPILFDSCFGVSPSLESRHMWVANPGPDRMSQEHFEAMDAYARAVVTPYVGDKRIALWDVMNEPSVTVLSLTEEGKAQIWAFVAHYCHLVHKLDPTHAITVGVASFDNSRVVDLVDVLSCHSYAPTREQFREALSKTRSQARAAGKLFHHPAGYVDLRGWDEFFVRSEGQKREGWPLDSWGEGTPIPEPYPNSVYNRDRVPANRFFLEWGAVPDEREEEMADTIRANWACDILRQKHDKPFFLAVGLYAPHFPNYAPQKYFDLYDAEQIKAPPYKEDDLDDLPPQIRKAKIHRKSAHHQRLVEIGAVEDAIHGYLASVSYADAMLGRIMKTLRESPHADNTVVVLWSDHGYHHGEKGDWGKHTLWERTTNVPFIWAGPGVDSGATVDATVSLIDMYPTFIEMCGLPTVEGLEGASLADTLRKPSTATDRNVLVPYLDPGGYAIVNEQWRYIHYSDDAEELYDVRKDPNEWENLAEDLGYAAVKRELRGSAPKTFAPTGSPKNRLKLVAEGEEFLWKAK